MSQNSTTCWGPTVKTPEPAGVIPHGNHDCEEARVVMMTEEVEAKIISFTNKLEDLEECYVTEVAGILFPFLFPQVLRIKLGL